MRIHKIATSQEDFLICIAGSNYQSGQMVKEAMSQKDFMATLMAMFSFLMLPNEVRHNTDMDAWVAKKGGSAQTASQISQSVGKSKPEDVTVNELKAVFKAPQKPGKIDQSLTVPSATPKVKAKPSNEPAHAVPYQSYWMGRDKTHRGELNEKVVDNSINLMRRVNALLKELGISTAKVNSGWRPPTYNEELRRKGVPAARKSKHISGEAVDLADVGHVIANSVMKDPSILERHGLWMEDPSRTRTWVHFDLGSGRNADRMPDGSKRKNRIFKP